MASKLTCKKYSTLTAKYKEDKIISDGTIIKCEACDSVLRIDSKHQAQQIQRHIESLHHREFIQKLNKRSAQQQFLSESFRNSEEKSSKQKEFYIKLTRAFLQVNIPLHKINSKPMKNFLEEYTGKIVPDESTLRKNYVHPILEETIEKIRQTIGDSSVYFILDETTDAKQRFILNILVLPLNGKFTKPMLLKVTVLEKTNNSTVMKAFVDSCSFLWSGNIQYDKVLLAVTDQAAYMTLAVRNLKALFTNLNHVTCLAHSLHRVCETIREEYSLANELVATIRKILLKAPARIQLYKEETNLALPPDAIVTRWGTWISCATFYAENYTKIRSFIEKLPTDSKACEKAKTLIESDDVKDELFNCATFFFLVETIEKLEVSGLGKETQWALYCDAGEKLTGFAKEKFVSSLEKNPDVKYFALDKNPEFRLRTAFAPLVSVDVERSFSQYKMILSDRRHNLTPENIEKINVISCNRFSYE